VTDAVNPDGTPVSFDNLPLWAEVDLGRIRTNVGRLKDRLRSGARLLAVVKADGYGHGAPMAAAAALEGGADWLGVARVHEGAALRQAGITSPVLLLAEPHAEAVPHAVELDLVEIAGVDVEGQSHMTLSLRRPRRQRWGGGNKARTNDVTVAVFEVVAGQTPFCLRCHLSLPASPLSSFSMPRF